VTGGILIVEDEGLIALDLKMELERSGFTVVMIADNAADALVSAEQLRPALVLMDIRLRGVRDGIETADLIRRNFHIPVMFVTAFADRETIFRARVTGPFDYIIKPFHGVDFRDRIDTAIEEHKRTEKLRLAIEQDKIRLRI
jgi:DNA-binding response OmpR family regulator